ncbi:MAG: hypothetical protein GF353_15530 [Candidatus Lokiarchaeota archaeon]|nr:hypothetical protein [Candidatus Lokiarchaeota archaeon]
MKNNYPTQKVISRRNDIMDDIEFEKCKEIPYYDNFMETALDYDNLTMEDYKTFMGIILPIVLEKTEKDPVLLFEEIIEDLRKKWTASEELPFHGPWHHGLVPAVIIASLKNNGYDFEDVDIKEAYTRGLKIPAGGCGFCGTCGGGSGLGIAISIVLRATPFHDQARSKAFKAAIQANERIGKLGGPRCCRLSGYTALEQAVKTLNNIDFNLPKEKMIGRCEIHYMNPQCHGNRCPFYPRK